MFLRVRGNRRSADSLSLHYCRRSPRLRFLMSVPAAKSCDLASGVRTCGRLPVTFCLGMEHAPLIPSHGTAGYPRPPSVMPSFPAAFTPYRPPNHFPPRSTARTTLTSFRSHHLRNLFLRAALPPFLPPFRLTPPSFRPLPTFPPRFPPHRTRPYHLPVAVCRRPPFDLLPPFPPQPFRLPSVHAFGPLRSRRVRSHFIPLGGDNSRVR